MLKSSLIVPGGRYKKPRLNTTSSFHYRERAKPDTAKVNGKNIQLPLREHCNFSTFYVLADLFQAGATSCKKTRLNNVRQTRMTLDIGHSRDTQKHVNEI